MAKNTEPTNAWEYVDWLYLSGRLTAEEHLKLKKFMLDMEYAVYTEGC
jgi:hypothetical protein